MEIQLSLPRLGTNVPVGFTPLIAKEESIPEPAAGGKKLVSIFPYPADQALVKYLNDHHLTEPLIAHTIIAMVNSKKQHRDLEIKYSNGRNCYKTCRSEFGHFEKSSFIICSKIPSNILTEARRHYLIILNSIQF